MAKNVKMQVFVTPGFYVQLQNKARELNINYRSDSELMQKVIISLQNIVNELQLNEEKLQGRILSFNRIIQEKETALQAALRKPKKKGA